MKDNVKLDHCDNNTLKAQLITSKGLSGISLLYLGHLDQKPYIIHSMRGCLVKDNKIHMLNKVAVTNLKLGDKSKNKSLLERTTLISVMK